MGEVSGRLELVIFFFYYEPNFFSVGRGGRGVTVSEFLSKNPNLKKKN